MISVILFVFAIAVIGGVVGGTVGAFIALWMFNREA